MLSVINLAARNIKEQTELKRLNIIKEYLVRYATYYIPPRACGRTLLKNKLILEEMEIQNGKIKRF